MRELSSFVQDTARGLSNKVSDGDYAGLVDIMGHLMAIRDRQISNEQHFKPLKSTAELLKTYGQQLPESVYEQLEVCTNSQIHSFLVRYVHFYLDILPETQELPEKWKSLRKIAFTVKHEVAPLQSNEVSVIRRKCVRFEVRLCVWYVWHVCVSGVGCQCGNPLQRAQYLIYKPAHFLSCIIYDWPQCAQL